MRSSSSAALSLIPQNLKIDHFSTPQAYLPPAVCALVRRGGFFSLGESYMEALWDQEPLHGFLSCILKQRASFLPRISIPVLRSVLADRLLNPQVHAGVFTVAKRHYDLGNDLFSAMLDKSMSYTCGYWDSAEDLARAQEAKLALICRKLNLEPGMHVLDIGCGWGNFAKYAAEYYGVSVTGVTISHEQASLARIRCRDLPVTIRLQDYREIRETFDRVVSIEMIEAVGRKNLKSFFSTASKALRPGGCFLLQAISTESFSRYSQPAVDQFVAWLLKYIFPNGYPPKMSELVHWSRGQFTMENLDCLSPSYSKTLEAWEKNFEAAWPTLRARYGDEFRRMWRFYLNGCRAFFDAGLVDVYQILYRKT